MPKKKLSDEELADLKAIKKLHEKLETIDPLTTEYGTVLNHIVKFDGIKPSPKKLWWQPSPDALVGAVASVVTVGLILVAEHVVNQVVSSKAIGFVPKSRI